eukprot:6767557-Pyramimonas_sp.AAC.1
MARGPPGRYRTRRSAPCSTAASLRAHPQQDIIIVSRSGGAQTREPQHGGRPSRRNKIGSNGSQGPNRHPISNCPIRNSHNGTPLS